MHFSAHGTSCCWPCLSQVVKNITQKSNEPVSETLAYVSQRLCLLDRYNKMHVHRTRIVLDCFNTSYGCETSHNKLCNWHADSSRRSIVHLSRERTAPRDLELNLSQTLHLVQFISELMIFIYKQLKRPVAFSVVQESFVKLFSELCSNLGETFKLSSELSSDAGVSFEPKQKCVTLLFLE